MTHDRLGFVEEHDENQHLHFYSIDKTRPHQVGDPIGRIAAADSASRKLWYELKEDGELPIADTLHS